MARAADPALDLIGAVVDPALELIGAVVDPALELVGAVADPALELVGAVVDPALDVAGSPLLDRRRLRFLMLKTELFYILHIFVSQEHVCKT